MVKSESSIRSPIVNYISALFLIASVGIYSCHSPHKKTYSREIVSESISINDDVIMCFQKDKNKNDARLCVVGQSDRVVNPEGDTIPWYTYYSGPIPSELSSFNDIDSLEAVVNNSVNIRGVVVSTNLYGTDTTLATTSKYRPVIVKSIIDAAVIYRESKKYRAKYH